MRRCFSNDNDCPVLAFTLRKAEDTGQFGVWAPAEQCHCAFEAGGTENCAWIDSKDWSSRFFEVTS